MLDPESFFESDTARFKASFGESGGGGGLTERSVGTDFASGAVVDDMARLRGTFTGFVELFWASSLGIGRDSNLAESGCCS